MPNVVLTNAKIGEMKADPFSVMVRKESEPEPFSYASSVEDKIYPGADNSLVLSRKVYAEYGCTFDLRDFPFDNQKCKMNFSMASAKASYIVLTTGRDDIKYHVRNSNTLSSSPSC